MMIYVNALGSNYSEIPTGEIECQSVEAFASEWGLEIIGNKLVAEWGNGEGVDEFEYRISPTQKINRRSRISWDLTTDPRRKMSPAQTGTIRQFFEAVECLRKTAGSFASIRRAAWYKGIRLDMYDLKLLHDGAVTEVDV